MRILFVAAELTPWAKVGGLGDVIGSLPKALALQNFSKKNLDGRAKLGTDVSVVIPFYEEIRQKKIRAKKRGSFSVSLANENQTVGVYEARLPKSRVRVLLLENKKYLSRGPVYFERTAFAGSFKEIQRFLFFSRAVYELLSQNYADRTQNYAEKNKVLRISALNRRKSAMSADIVHCHDWHSGALVAMLKGQGSCVKSQVIFTIHNLANQGAWNAKEVERWLIGRPSIPPPRHGRSGNKLLSPAAPAERASLWRELVEGTPFKKRGDTFNFVAEGIENADAVTTVSPTYAKEILTKQYGAGLEKLLAKRARQKKLVGILNGIDYADWPREKRNKTQFQKQLGLEVSPRSPIFGLVARLTYQKGINLIAPVVPYFIKKYNSQFVFLGQGEPQNEKALKILAKKYPKNVYVKIGFDASLARHIYAQSDFFLIPSLFEPSGLGQMIAMRYGAVPIVRKTGGLKDTVAHKKTGFVFEKPISQALARAIEEALRVFANRKKFQKLIANCRREDFGWRKSAKKYMELYRKISRS